MEVQNVLRSKLEVCGCDPMTGWYRDGYCNTDVKDNGIHTVCCVVTDEFLEFAKTKGNDLKTPMPQFGFPGLKPGDHWCVCAGTWLEAYRAGAACPVKLESTHEETLAIIPIEALMKFQYKEVQ
jgi:uncharacterized protein (DUF2237 family)